MWTADCRRGRLMHPTSIKFDDTELAKLDAFAKATSRTRSAVVKLIIRRAVLTGLVDIDLLQEPVGEEAHDR
jgi:predicted transcriptional regulator